jgi:hypothetical protein
MVSRILKGRGRLLLIWCRLEGEGKDGTCVINYDEAAVMYYAFVDGRNIVLLFL